MKILSVVSNTKINQTGIELQLMLFQLHCKCSLVCKCVTGTQPITYTYCSTTPETTERQTDWKTAMFTGSYNAACCLLMKFTSKQSGYGHWLPDDKLAALQEAQQWTLAVSSLHYSDISGLSDVFYHGNHFTMATILPWHTNISSCMVSLSAQK